MSHETNLALSHALQNDSGVEMGEIEREEVPRRIARSARRRSSRHPPSRRPSVCRLPRTQPRSRESYDLAGSEPGEGGGELSEDEGVLTCALPALNSCTMTWPFRPPNAIRLVFAQYATIWNLHIDPLTHTSNYRLLRDRREDVGQRALLQQRRVQTVHEHFAQLHKMDDDDIKGEGELRG